MELRPRLAPALGRLLASVAQTVPGLGHVEPRRLLLMAGQARGGARASIRSLVTRAAVTRVVIDGQHRLYEINLRPLWFRASTLERRLEALLHELWHTHQRFDGRLDRRNLHPPGQRQRRSPEVAALLRTALDRLDPELLAPLGHHGEVLMPAWLQRPVLTGEAPPRARYSNKDIYLQPVTLITPAASRSVWW